MMGANSLDSRTFHVDVDNDLKREIDDHSIGRDSRSFRDVPSGESTISRINSDLTSENSIQENMIPSWQYGDEESGHHHSSWSTPALPLHDEEGGSSSFIDVARAASPSTVQCLKLYQPTLEITVSMELSEEQTSPSSVSLQRSLDDISPASLPVLPLHIAVADEAKYTCSNNIAIPGTIVSTYRSRCRRRNDEMDRLLSFDQRQDMVPASILQSPPSYTTGHYRNNNSSSLDSNISNNNVSFFRKSPRYFMLFCAVAIIVLSIHDRLEDSRHHPYSTGNSGSRREEVAFPLIYQHTPSETTIATLARDSYLNTSTDTSGKASIPKYYFPKVDERHNGNKLPFISKVSERDITDGQNGAPANQQVHHQQKHFYQRSSFAMARSHPQAKARPVFVPDQPLPGGGFRKPVERFIFDPNEKPVFQESSEFSSTYNNNGERKGAFSWWTSWLATLALIGMLIDTGWKEYRRCRLIEEEQRRL